MEAEEQPTDAPPQTNPGQIPAPPHSAPSMGGQQSMRTGVRTLSGDAEAREFVLRENAKGNQTYSIVEDGNLFRLTRATRVGTNIGVEDLFVTKLESLCGFSHSKFDWLDTTRFLWYLTSFLGIILTFISMFILMPYSNLFVLFFFVGTMLSVFQIADPELITFETNSGKHRLLIYRAGSNRIQTNASMDLIDPAMQEVLRGNELDSTAIDNVVNQIQEGIAQAVAQKAAAQQAAMAQAQMQAQAQQAAMAQAQQAAMAQAQMQAQQMGAAPTAPPAGPPQVNQMPVENSPAPTTPAPTAPPSGATMPVENVPPVANPPPEPIPPPPMAAPSPLPPIPTNLDPALVAGMDMPTESISSAPEVLMQAAPRDEALSEGEKEDILSDLGDD